MCSLEKTPNISKENVVDKYVSIIQEFLNIMTNHSKDYKPSLYILYIGIISITHIFYVVLFYTENIDITYQTSQHSIYYYLEYIEQVANSTSFLMLDNKDAIFFIYKKTIEHINIPSSELFIDSVPRFYTESVLYNTRNSKERTGNKKNTEMDAKPTTKDVCSSGDKILQWKHEGIKNFATIVKVLLFFTDEIILSSENKNGNINGYEDMTNQTPPLVSSIQYTDLVYISVTHLKPLLLLFLPVDVYKYIKTIRLRFPMNFVEYTTILDEIYLRLKTMRKKGMNFDELDFNELYIKSFLIEENFDKLKGLWEKRRYKAFVTVLF
jgi:hypothetical protein